MSSYQRSQATTSAPANYLRVLRERWVIVVLTMLVCVAAGVLSERSTAKKYSAQSDLLISPVDNSDPTFVGINVFRNISADPTSNVLTLARYLNTPATAQLVRSNLHLRQSAGALLGMISVQPLSQTDIVSVRASAKSGDLAARLANGFADATITRRTQQVQSDVQKVVTRLQAQINQSGSPSSPSVALVQQRLAGLKSLIGLPDPSVAVLNRAETPLAADQKSTKLVVLATALAGLLLGFGIALLADSLGGKIRSENDLLTRARIPILARVPRLTPWLVREYFGRRTNLPPAAWESYRTLRTNLLRSTVPGETPVILVTSAMPGEGKTFTAINLAITLAAQNSRVLLVDGDFRRPMIASFFGVAPPRDGFRSTFIERNFRKVTRDAPGYANLRLVLPTLRDLTQIDELDPERVAHTFDALRDQADVVVVDSAPADVSDPLILAAAADMILIAVRIGYTRRERFDSLQESLSQHVVSATGLIVTVRETAKEAVHGSTMPVALEFKKPSTPAARQR